MKKTKRRALYIIAALLAALFVLSCLVGFAACGGGDNDEDDATVSTVSISGATSVEEGKTVTLTASVVMSDNSAYTGSYTWASSSESVSLSSSTTSTVTVTGVTAGSSSDITVTAGGVTSAKYTVTVTAATPDEPTVTEVKLDKSSLSLSALDGETATLTAEVTMSDSSSYSGDYTWSSTDTSQANVKLTTSGNTATVEAVSATTTPVTITVKAGDEDATCTVTVTDKTASTLGGLSSVLTSGGSVALTENITVSDSTLEVKADSTIDLNGKTISTGTNSDGIDTIVVDENATLTITDSSTGETGSIKNTYKSGEGESSTSVDNAAAIETKGTLIIEGGSISSSSVGIRAEGGSVTINGGTITSDYFALWESGGVVDVTINDGSITGTNKGICVCGDSDYGYGSGNYQDSAQTTLTITGGEITCTNDSAITTLGVTTKSTAVINITGGTITSNAQPDTETDGTTQVTTVVTSYPAIYLPSGTLNISGGTISGMTAVEVRGGDVTVSGGKLICTATENDPQGDDASANKSGAKTYGYSLAVYPYGINSAIKSRMDSYTSFDNTVNVQVTAGTFDGDIYVAAESEYAGSDRTTKWSVDFEGQENSEYVVQITDSFGLKATAYSENGTEINEGATGASYYIFSSKVTSASDESTLTQALTTGGEIVITKDITLSGTTIEGDTATALTVSADTEIDLAGKSISTGTLSSALNTIEVSGSATLTIIDSTGEGSIANTYTGATSTDNAAAIAVAEGGTLVIESGTISSTSVGVRAEGVTSDSEGRATVTIDGGEISSTYFSVFASGDADVTISGGTISGTNKGICIGGDSNFGYSSYQYNTKTTLTITGGEISCTNDSAICTLGVGSADSAEITISGGEISNSAQVTGSGTSITAPPAVYVPSGTLTITGGTITSTLTAVEIRGGTAKISGGTLITTYSGEEPGDDATQETFGAKTYGYALSVYAYGVNSNINKRLQDSSDNYTNDVNVTVTGGTFVGDIYVAAEAEYSVSGNAKWQVKLNDSTATDTDKYVVTINFTDTTITATTTAYDADGKVVVTDSTDPSYDGSATVSYYIVTVSAVETQA